MPRSAINSAFLMLLRVVLRHCFCVFSRPQMMVVWQMSVVPCLFLSTRLMMLSSFAMMTGCLFVMFRGCFMMLSASMASHSTSP